MYVFAMNQMNFVGYDPKQTADSLMLPSNEKIIDILLILQ